MLEENGYRVLVGTSPDEALSIVSSIADRIDLLLTDVVMPDLSGPDLAARVRSIRPGTRVVYMSGYVDHSFGPDAPHADDVDLVQKPFTEDALLRRIQDVLDRADPQPPRP
jgi:two-component system cell cycle sensor histidine kinase/response regulator CckA